MIGGQTDRVNTNKHVYDGRIELNKPKGGGYTGRETKSEKGVKQPEW